MKWSLYIGRISGIKLYIHWTFLILVAWIFIMYFRMGHGMKEALLGLGFVLTIFVCVILHELGHAFAARRYKIVTRNITILPIGGLANMERLPEKPARELWVAIAGPLVNMVLAILLYSILKLTGGMPNLADLEAAGEGGEQVLMGGGGFLFNLMFVNILLFAFNLIPAFPMDGGRMLRAILSFKMDRVKATRIAATIGQFLAILFVFAGLFYDFWLIFIGIFIFLGAGGEAAYEATKNILSGYSVRDVMMTKFTILSPEDPFSKVVHHLLDTQEQEFVIAEGHYIHGILTRKNLIKGLHDHGGGGNVAQAMQTEFLTFQPDMDLKEAFQQLMASDCAVAPVVNEGELMGIVDKENINELLMVRQALQN